MSVSIWSAKGEVKERFSSSNKGTSESFQNSDSPETAVLWQFSKVTRHQLPSRTVLPFDPTGKCCHPLHLTSPTCWPVGAAQVFGELPKGSLTAMLHLPCEPPQGTEHLKARGDRFTTLGAFIRAKHPTQNYLYFCHIRKIHNVVCPFMKKTIR